MWIRRYKYPVYEGIWRIRDETEWYTCNANVPISLSSMNTYVNECRSLLLYIFAWYKVCLGNLPHAKKRLKRGFSVLLLRKQLLFSCLLIKVSFAVRRTTTMRSHKWRLLIQSIAIKSHPFPAYSAVIELHRVWWMKYPHKPITEPMKKRAHQAIKKRII